MAAEGIFLIKDGKLQVLEEKPYDSEDLLQQALASFPEVLAGSSTAEATVRPLLLVRREMGVPKAQGASPTWSLDHLFVDAEGVPVVVEVKRSSDTRIRREVLGQMLDYAANAARYWPLADLRAAFDDTAAQQRTTGDERLREILPEMEPEDFWERVGDNLKAGHIRMVFVADHLPAELVRVIEFLNEQMRPAEVLGVEVPQYVGAGHQVLVPRVIGRTSSAVAAKGPPGRQWDEEGFLMIAAERHGQGQGGLFKRLFDHVRDHGVRFGWGRAQSPGVSGWYSLGGSPTPVWNANAGGASGNDRAYLYVYLPEVRRRVSPEVFEAFVGSLAAIPAYEAKMDEARVNDYQRKYPQVYIAELLQNPQDVDQLFSALDGLAAV